jgi:hypothetical protein
MQSVTTMAGGRHLFARWEDKRTEVGTAFITSAGPHHPADLILNRRGLRWVGRAHGQVGLGGRDECCPYEGVPRSLILSIIVPSMWLYDDCFLHGSRKFFNGLGTERDAD